MKIRALLAVFFALFLSVCGVCGIHGSSKPAFASSAAGMITIEAQSGRILYESNSHRRLPMASTTKIVTAITVIENADLNALVKIDDRAVGVEGSSIYLQHGEVLSVKNLLYGLMLQSGNDCAVALALHVGGSIESFANMMNDLAKRVGATESNFVNPHGLHDDNHYTTAYDLAIISAYAMKNPAFKEIVSTKSHKMPYHGHEYDRVISNKNKILFNFDGGNGIKTGYTKKAGRCLVASAQRNGMTVISVVLNCGPMFEECSSLMEKAFGQYEQALLVEKDCEIARAEVTNGKKSYASLYTKTEFRYPLTKEERDRVRIDIYTDELIAPLKKDAVCGKICVTLDNQLLFEENLYNIYSIDAMSVLDKLKDKLTRRSN